eukprot:5084576-Alexandrium_andersonii.AAC.1
MRNLGAGGAERSASPPARGVETSGVPTSADPEAATLQFRRVGWIGPRPRPVERQASPPDTRHGAP